MKKFKDWCWISYTKTGWVFEGRKQYIGHFSADGISVSADIMFVARRPAKAMKHLIDELNKGVDIGSLENQTIN